MQSDQGCLLIASLDTVNCINWGRDWAAGWAVILATGGEGDMLVLIPFLLCHSHFPPHHPLFLFFLSYAGCFVPIHHFSGKQHNVTHKG